MLINRTSAPDSAPRMPSQPTDKERQLKELQIFHDVAKALTSTLDLDMILKAIMEKMAAYFQPAVWSLLMLDEADELSFAVAVGENVEDVNAVRLKTGESLARFAMQTGETLIIPDLAKDSRIDKASFGPRLAKLVSLGCIPVRTETRVLGVIELADFNIEVYQKSELLLRALADYAAIAIENARAVRRIQELSITDDCTGLFNARHLYTVLSEEVHRSERFGYEFSLLFLDLDHFKRVNDEYGHLVGTRLLGEFGHWLRDNLRLIDAAFRYGGDEFAIILPQTSKEAALAVARRLRTFLHEHRWLEGENVSLRVRASVGIASYPADATTPSGIVELADGMMYHVKQTGRDNIAVFGIGIVD